MPLRSPRGNGGCSSCGSLPDTATAFAIAGPVRSPAPICGSPVGTGVRGSPVSGLPFRMEAFREIPAATIATVIYTVSFLSLQSSQPSRGLFVCGYEDQCDTPTFTTNLVLIADMVFIQQPTGLYIQILA